MVRSGQRRCGLPLQHVIETCRPLPIERLGDAPAFVLGLARVRGEVVPVVDLRLILGDLPEQAAARFVSLRISGRRIALAVDDVLGLVQVPAMSLEALPPLMLPGTPAVESLAQLDQALLLILRMARLLPPAGLEST